MKKSKLLVSLLASAMVVGMSACKKDEFEGKDQDIVAVYKAYKANAEANGDTPLSYDDWIASIKGEKGDPGEPGAPGKDGKDGVTPTIEIGANGNWIINGVDSGKKAQGENGADATPPTIEIGLNDHWYINGTDTNITAKGANGQDAIAPVVSINDQGYWCINNIPTNVKAVGAKGDKGDPGDKGDKGDNGENGLSAYEIFKKYNPHYTGDEKQYARDMKSGALAYVPEGHEGRGTFENVDSAENPGYVDLIQHCDFCNEDIKVSSAFKRVTAEFTVSESIPGYTSNSYPFNFHVDSNSAHGILTSYDFKGNEILGNVNSYIVLNVVKGGVFSIKYNISNFTDPLTIYKNTTTGNNNIFRECGAQNDVGNEGYFEVDVVAGDYLFLNYYSTSRNYGRDNAILEVLPVESTYSYAKFDSNGGTACDPVMTQDGKIIDPLPTPVAKNKFFEGWYTDAALTDKVEEDTVVAAGATLYAKWSNAAVAVLNPNGGLVDDKEIQFRVGTAPELPTPIREGYYFQGWFTDAAFTTPYVNEAKSKGFEVFAKWFDLDNRHALEGKYDGFRVYGTSSLSAATTNVTVDIEMDGSYAIKTGWDSSLNGNLSAVVDDVAQTSDPNVGDVIVLGNDWLVVAESANFTTSTYIHFVKKNAAASSTNVKTALINDKKLGFVSFPDGNDTKMVMIDYDAHSITADVKLVDSDGNDIDISKLSGGTVMTFAVKKGDVVVANYYYSSNGKFITTAPTGVVGTFTNADNPNDKITFNGHGKAFYSPFSSSSAIDATLISGNDYYVKAYAIYRKVVTVDPANRTFTMVDRTIEITLDYNYVGSPEPATETWGYEKYESISSTNSNPTRAGYAFDGWYTLPDGGEKITGTKSLTADTTFYAHWIEAKTLTVYNNNGGTDPVVSYFVAGTTPEIPEPEKDGFLFAGWYTDELLTTPYVSGAKNDDVIVYAKYVSTPAFVGTYYGYNSDVDGVKFYDAANKPVAATNAYSININGTTSGKNSTTWKYTNFDESKATLKLGNNTTVLFVEANDGTMFEFFDYTQGNSWATDDDMYIAVKADATPTFNDQTICWDNGNQKIIKLTVNSTVYYIYVNGYNASTNPYGGNAYVDVTFKNSNGDVLSFDQLASKDGNTTTFAQDIVIYSGDVVVGRCGGNGSTLVSSDMKQGSYTGTYNGVAATLSLNGYGVASVETADDTFDGSYTVTGENEVKFVSAGGISATFTLSGNSMSQVLDGYQGDYAVIDLNGDFIGIATLTGYGVGTFEDTSSAVSNITYEANGTTVVITMNGDSKGYAIDNSDPSDVELHELVAYTVTNTSSNNNAYVWTYDAVTNTWTSGNKGQQSSWCAITITANSNVTVAISYWASSESDYRWDYFHIDLNGTEQFHCGGSMTASSVVSKTITLKAGDVLVLKYQKDSSTDSGEDQAYINRLMINGVQYVG